MLIVVAVKDLALEAFLPPFMVPAIGAAMRSFVDEVNRKDGPMFAHPEDYELYVLASFDESRGVYTQDLRRVSRASEVKHVSE